MLEPLAWCFYSRHGRLTRQEFIHAILAILVLDLLLKHLVDRAAFGTDPFYYSSPEALAQHQMPGEIIPMMLLLWPLLAVLLKRLHDLGRTYKSLVAWMGTVVIGGHVSASTAAVLLWAGIAFLAYMRGVEDAPAAADAGSGA